MHTTVRRAPTERDQRVDSSERESDRPGSAVRYQVFGQLAITVDGQVRGLSQRRERNVLAMLIAAHGRPLPAERLIDQLWAGDPPAQARVSLQVAISRLRSVVEPRRDRGAPGRLLVSVAGGYVLTAQEDDVDVWRFDSQLRAAVAAGPRDRVAISEAALGLWRGTPYADCADTAIVRAEAARLLESRLTLIEARADTLLELGHPEVVEPELRVLADEHPFRERLWSLVAISQYQTLRQADALGTLRTLRERLADELGVDPSPQVRELELAVLNHAPGLAVPERVALAAAPAGPDPASPRPPRAAPFPGLVGRADAVAALTRAVDRLLDGHGGAVTISGDAGIGKTRLATAVADYAESNGASALIGRCHEADVAPAYWPWLPVLHGLADAVPADAVPAEVRALLDADPEGRSDAGAATLRTYDAVGRLLAAAARRRPLLVVLEDLQWADTSSLRMLGYVAETLQAPILMVGTRRTSGVSGSPALTAALASLARAGSERIRLDGLGRADVGRLLQTELGPQAAALAGVVAERTEGNPFFVIEFGRLLRARMITDPRQAAHIPVPEGIGDVLRLRLQRLPAQARRLLTIAAVAGRTVDPHVISTVSQEKVVDVLEALDGSQAAGLLAEGGRGYQFAHALVRETIYADLPVGRRVRLHAAVAEAMQPMLAADPEIRTDVAHHYWLAAPLDAGYAAKAAQHLRVAAHTADARNAFEESVDLWARALAAVALGGEGTPAERCELLVAQAVAQLRISDIAGARDHVGEAMAIARSAQRWDLVGIAAIALTGSGEWGWRPFGTTDQTMIDALGECLDHLPDGPLAARVMASLQMEYYCAGRIGQADACGRRSVAMARAAGDPTVLLRVLLVRALGVWGPGTHDERIAIGEEMLTLPMDGELEVSVLWQYAAALHQAGRPGDAELIMDRCRVAAARLRHTGADVPIAWWRFMRAVEREDPAVRQIGDSALDQHRRSTVVTLDELSGIHAIRTAGPGAEVPPDVMAAAAASSNAGFRALVGYAMIESGDIVGATGLVGPEPREDAPAYSLLAANCLQAAVYAAAGMTGQIRTCLARIVPFSGDVVTFGSVDHLGAVDFFIAAGLAALGERGRARAHALRAVELCVRVGNRPWERRSRAQLASLGGSGRPDR